MRIAICLFLLGSAVTQFRKPDAEATIDAGRRHFALRCAMCHGADGMGGERAPGVAGREGERMRSEQDLRDLISKGVPEAGMPGFQVAAEELGQIVAFVRSLTMPAIERAVGGNAARGRDFFFGHGGCAACHIVEGRGGLGGPDLSNLGRRRTLAEIE